VQYENFEGFYKSLEKSKSPRFHTFLDDNKCTLVFDLDWPCCPDFELVGTDATTLQKCMSATAIFLHTKYGIPFTAQVLILSDCGQTKNKDGEDTKLHKRSYHLVYPEYRLDGGKGRREFAQLLKQQQRGGFMPKAVDIGIYNTGAKLRSPMSSKCFGERPLLPVDRDLKPVNLTRKHFPEYPDAVNKATGMKPKNEVKLLSDPAMTFGENTPMSKVGPE
jgi:hypothetical protein